MRNRKLYQLFATLVGARLNCIEAGNNEWRDRHTERAHKAVKLFMPSGSGFDSGTSLKIADSTGEKLVFGTSFHHMNPDGYYVGWSHHDVIVTPSLQFDFTIRVTGRDCNDIKDYIAEMFQSALTDTVDEDKFYQDEALREKVT